MQKLIAAIVFWGSITHHPALADDNPTTVILVRHAEKRLDEGRDPNLTTAGFERAERLAEFALKQKTAALYATEYKRTQQTVMPSADLLSIEINVVDALEIGILSQRIKNLHKGQTIMVAGHNITVPRLIRSLGGPEVAPIPETEYDNLYILTLGNETTLKKLKY